MAFSSNRSKSPPRRARIIQRAHLLATIDKESPAECTTSTKTMRDQRSHSHLFESLPKQDADARHRYVLVPNPPKELCTPRAPWPQRREKGARPYALPPYLFSNA